MVTETRFEKPVDVTMTSKVSALLLRLKLRSSELVGLVGYCRHQAVSARLSRSQYTVKMHKYDVVHRDVYIQCRFMHVQAADGDVYIYCKLMHLYVQAVDGDLYIRCKFMHIQAVGVLYIHCKFMYFLHVQAVDGGVYTQCSSWISCTFRQLMEVYIFTASSCTCCTFRQLMEIYIFAASSCTFRRLEFYIFTASSCISSMCRQLMHHI